MPKVGDTAKWDNQSDVFQGEYRYVEHLGGNRWMIEYLEPSDELIEEIEEYYLRSPQPYLGWFDPFGPGRREATRQEALDEEVMERIERAGRRTEIRIVSREPWAAMF